MFTPSLRCSPSYAVGEPMALDAEIEGSGHSNVGKMMEIHGILPRRLVIFDGISPNIGIEWDGEEIPWRNCQTHGWNCCWAMRWSEGCPAGDRVPEQHLISRDHTLGAKEPHHEGGLCPHRDATVVAHQPRGLRRPGWLPWPKKRSMADDLELESLGDQLGSAPGTRHTQLCPHFWGLKKQRLSDSQDPR